MEGYSTINLEPPDPAARMIAVLRNELSGIFDVRSVETDTRGRHVTFAGQLLHDPDVIYNEISRRFRMHGFTPMLSRESQNDVIFATAGIADEAAGSNPLINVLLLIATIITTLSAGASLSGANLLDALMTGSWPVVRNAVVAGAPFAIALLGILGVHELGHYVAARVHGVQATLPYFIPMPFVGFGTLGAFIALKSPMKDRKILFDIGLAGPFAGFFVALPLLVIGLLFSTTVVPLNFPSLWTLDRMGSSILVSAVVETITDIPEGRTLLLDPIYRAAWLGVFLTSINLLPVGQLDGGHAMYALFGRFAHVVAYFTFLLLIIAGAFVSTNWFVWAFFIMFGGLRHPPPLNDITGVGRGRKIIGALTILLFILILTPVPFR